MRYAFRHVGSKKKEKKERGGETGREGRSHALCPLLCYDRLIRWFEGKSYDREQQLTMGRTASLGSYRNARKRKGEGVR